VKKPAFCVKGFHLRIQSHDEGAGYREQHLIAASGLLFRFQNYDIMQPKENGSINFFTQSFPVTMSPAPRISLPVR
jgi:hypothetical protein